MEVKNKKELYEKLEFWKKITSRTNRCEHFDLTNNSYWINNIKEIRMIIDNLKNTEDPEEIRKLLAKLFGIGRNNLIWANQTFILPSFINECSQD